MTVLVGAISEAGQVALACDSMQWDKQGESRSGLWKTLRVNDHCAVGFSGNGTYAGQIAANLMGKPEWAHEAGEADLLSRIEGESIRRDKWSCSGTSVMLNTVLFQLAQAVRGKAGGLPDVNVLFAGKEGDKACLRQWTSDGGNGGPWRTLGVDGTGFPETQFMVFGPEAIDGLAEILRNTALPFRERVLIVCQRYAERFPKKVNSDFWIREARTSFGRLQLGVDHD